MNENETTEPAQSSPATESTGPKKIRPPSKYLKPEFQKVTSEVRRITPTEAQRLQGFNENHLESGGMNKNAHQYSAVGNSWAVNCARRVIQGIHKADAIATGKKEPFKYGTISSGVEAHTQAAEDLGDRAVFYSEIAPEPSKFLARKYPETPNLGDMTLVDYDPDKKVIHNREYEGYKPAGKDVLGFVPYKTDGVVEIPAEYGEVTLVSGGTPCQSYSVAGKRAGGAEGSGTRSSLAFQLPRIGKAVGARWIMWENVAGAFSSNGGSDFLWFLYRCMEAGYTLAWRTFDAQYTFCDRFPRAVPQRRRRVFMVGYKGDDWRVPVRALFEPLKALGTNSPDRKVGKGCTHLNPKFDEDKAEVYTTGRNGGLKEKKQKDAPALDLFSLMCGEDGGEGRKVLHQKDLELAFLNESDISKVSLVEFFQFCKTIGKVEDGKGYCGNLFSDRQRVYKTVRYAIVKGDDGKTERKMVVGEDGQVTEVEYVIPEGKSVTTEKVGDGVFEDTWQDGTIPFEVPCVEALADAAMKNIGNAGILSKGRICTMTTPEWTAGLTEEELATLDKEIRDLYDGTVCGLSDILEDNPDPKYLLSWRACFGIICRAFTRKKDLPAPLLEALLWQIAWEPEKVKWWMLNGPNDEERAKGKLCWDCVICANKEKYICDLDKIAEEAPKKRGDDDGPDEEETDEIGEEDVVGLDADEQE